MGTYIPCIHPPSPNHAAGKMPPAGDSPIFNIQPMKPLSPLYRVEDMIYSLQLWYIGDYVGKYYKVYSEGY